MSRFTRSLVIVAPFWLSPKRRRARAALEDAREQIKAALGWEGELIFTASASEAAALALGRANAGARLVSAVEHDCVLQAAPDAERLPVLGDGALDLEVLAEAVRHKRPLLAVQQLAAKALFKAPYLLADRGLREVQTLCRPGETGAVHDRDKTA